MTKHILIADDEPSVLAMLRLFFQRKGYRVTAVSNGREAIDAALRDVPDLLLLDIQMPVKTGIEVVRELRTDARFATVPFIALTAYIRDFMPPAVHSAGFDHLLTKPFEFADLHAMVLASIERTQPE
jgi:CheY-like chemotaxis protein